MNQEQKDARQQRREERLREKDAEAREMMHARREKRDKKLAEPFANLMARRLFLLELVFVLGFGLLDVTRLIQGYTFTVAAMLQSLLIGAALTGGPVLLICANKFRKHREGDDSINLKPFQLYARFSLGILAVLLAGWAITALVGV